MVWLAEGKCIRKLELSKLEEDTEKKSTFEREKHQTDNNTAQEITKTLTAILKVWIYGINGNITHTLVCSKFLFIKIALIPFP